MGYVRQETWFHSENPWDWGARPRVTFGGHDTGNSQFDCQALCEATRPSANELGARMSRCRPLSWQSSKLRYQVRGQPVARSTVSQTVGQLQPAAGFSLLAARRLFAAYRAGAG